jgi:hypothetical protein
MLDRLAGALLLLLGASSALPSLAPAQDRSVPRFGPVVAPDTVQADRFDLGRLWSFAQPPLDYFGDEYDVRANERGLRHARLSTVRLPDCSGALVSGQGLVLTAARCVRSFLAPQDPDSLRSASFYADEQDGERPLPDLHAERVVAVEDVTAAVEAARSDVSAGRSGASKWETAMEAVEERRQRDAEANQRVEVVREAGGARYVAYTYHRYEDVRLAFVGDRSVGVSGRLGEPLTYPQHAWDVAVLRLYEADRPLQTPQHFEVRTQRGVRPGDAVFAVGYPPEIRRVETHDQLAVRRDLTLPAAVSALSDGTDRLRQYVDTSAAAEPWADRLSEAQMTLQETRARLEGLQNSYVMARLQSRDQQLRRAVAADSALARLEDGVIDRLAAIQQEKRTLASDYRAFSFLLHPSHSSATLRRALLAYRAQEGDTTSGEGAEALRDVPEQPPALDAAALAAHLHHLRSHLASDSTLLRALPDPEVAPSIVEASVFSGAKETRTQRQQGAVPESDPAIELVSVFYDRYAQFDDAWSTLLARERRLTDSLARVRHRAVDLPVALPKNRSLRIADGRILGYPYNGTVAPPFTTFYGLYSRHHALRVGDGRGGLPARWRTPPAAFDRSTPLATVASTDLGARTHGGPLLNTSLQLVGVVFDQNVQGAAGEYLFLPRRMRVVAADVRGVLEGLSLYEADRLVQEMTTETASR